MILSQGGETRRLSVITDNTVRGDKRMYGLTDEWTETTLAVRVEEWITWTVLVGCVAMLAQVNIDGRAGCTQIKREVRWKRGLLADTLVQLCDGLVVGPVRLQLRLQPTNQHSPLPCETTSQQHLLFAALSNVKLTDKSVYIVVTPL